jgi:hypothetical protein
MRATTIGASIWLAAMLGLEATAQWAPQSRATAAQEYSMFGPRILGQGMSAPRPRAFSPSPAYRDSGNFRTTTDAYGAFFATQIAPGLGLPYVVPGITNFPGTTLPAYDVGDGTILPPQLAVEQVAENEAVAPGQVEQAAVPPPAPEGAIDAGVATGPANQAAVPAVPATAPAVALPAAAAALPVVPPPPALDWQTDLRAATPSEQQLARQITAALGDRLRAPIQVIANGSTILLRGAVDSEASRRLAEVTASLAPGVREIRSELMVIGGIPER